jgi:hypothetical protein
LSCTVNAACFHPRQRDGRNRPPFARERRFADVVVAAGSMCETDAAGHYTYLLSASSVYWDTRRRNDRQEAYTPAPDEAARLELVRHPCEPVPHSQSEYI